MALTDTSMDTTKRMTTVNVVRKCLCRIQQNEQNRFVEKAALVSGTYKGTSTSLGIAFGNITSTAEFRRYGLSNNLEKTLKHIVDLFDEEQLMNAVEILIVHGDQVLIRIKRDDLVDLNGSILVVDVDQVMKTNIDEKTRCCSSPVVLPLKAYFRHHDLYKTQPFCVLKDGNRNLKLMIYLTLSYWLLGWVKNSLSK